MRVIHDEEELERYIKSIQEYCSEYPILIDEFIDNAVELDVDLLCDGKDVYIGKETSSSTSKKERWE